MEAGLIPAARDLVEEYLALLDALHEADGSYYRAMLLAVRASLSDAEGREGDVTTDLQAMWASTAGQAADVVRRGWRVLEPLLWKALETDTLEPEPVLRSIGEAFPGGEAILPFTAHPHAEVRRVAVTAAASSGHPELPLRLSKLARDPDQEVAAAAGAAERRLRDEPPPLTFKVLGDFAVSRGCWQVDDRAWDRRVAQRIVRYLLVSRGRAVPDDLLLEAFWPDVAERSARQRLNVAVSCARAALDVPGAESVIEATEHTLRLRLRERDSVDADQFENAAGMALAPDQNNSRGLLERAASMWGGDPLPHERYATWAAAWREHLTDLYARVLARLAEVLHAQEDALAATVAAKKLVELDPLNEQANALLMAAYARSGRRGQARTQYLACRRNLLDELGVEPAEETTQMQQRILAGERV